MTKIVARGDPIEPAYLTNLRVAAHGWGTVSGLAVSQRAAGANMSVDVASGEAWINGTKVTKGSTTNVVITAAHATYDRYDLVVINSSGTISVIAVTAAATSYANDYDFETNNAILLAEVEIPATDTTIETAQCTDKRIISFIEETDVANGIPRLDSSTDIIMSQLKTDVANGVAKLNASAKVPDANLESPVATHAALTDVHGIDDEYVLGHNPILYADYHTDRTTSTSYAKVWSFTIKALNPNPATIRLCWVLENPGDVHTCYGKIYKNGVAAGVEKSMSGATPEEFTDDVSFSNGDTIELWTKTSSTGAACDASKFCVLEDSGSHGIAVRITP